MNAFSPIGNTVNVAVTGSNQYLTLTSAGTVSANVMLTCIGTQTVFYFLNDGATPATTTTSHPLLPNTQVVVSKGVATHLAVIAGTTGSTVYATTGQGV